MTHRRLGEESNQSHDTECENDLNSDRSPPRPRVGNVRESEIDPVSDHSSSRDHSCFDEDGESTRFRFSTLSMPGRDRRAVEKGEKGSETQRISKAKRGGLKRKKKKEKNQAHVKNPVPKPVTIRPMMNCPPAQDPSKQRT